MPPLWPSIRNVRLIYQEPLQLVHLNIYEILWLSPEINVVKNTVGFDDPDNETYVQTMFMVRYGPVDSSRRKKHPFHGSFGFGIFTLEQLGSDQQVVKTMDDIYPGIELWELHKISMLQKRKTRLQNKVWQGHFYFVLTKNFAELSTK